MNYQVLARKWRPHNFSEVVGQSHVVQALTNALQHNRLHHAYLFTGTRGVGKTTLARILAKAINCENLQDFNPCGVCPVCREVDEGRFMDLIEVDAASRTKVEDTRDLLDNVQYAPNRGRYKVYLIDEVHMLSGHSFNALLKTLEEPPSHVKFLLATTDPQKIPVTVLSRCLQFNLKQLLPAQIFGQMTYILGQEGIESDVGALKLLSCAADGSMRDGLSLLDQAIVFGNGRVRDDDVRAMLGTVAQQPVEDILAALAGGNADAILAAISNMTDLSPDFSDVLTQILQMLHRIALFQAVPATVGQDGDAEMLASLSAQFSQEDVQLYYQIALMGQKDLDLAPDPRSGFEMVMLRMLAFRPAGINAPVPNANNTLPTGPLPRVAAAKPISSAPVSHNAEPIALVPVQPAIVQPVYATQATEQPSQIQEPPVRRLQSAPALRTDNWVDMIAAMGLSGPVKNLANNCVLDSIDDHVCQLSVDPNTMTIRSAKTEETLLKALQAYRGSQLKLVITAQKTATDTPAAQNLKERENRQQAAVDNINADANILALKEQFGAQVIPGTIEPR